MIRKSLSFLWNIWRICAALLAIALWAYGIVWGLALVAQIMRLT